MSDAHPEPDIVRKLADEVSQRLVRQTIRTLQGMKDRSMLLSGDDSELICVWEEICVQVQHQESFYWDAYVETLKAIIAGFVGELKRYELEAIWLVTRAGEEWLDEDEERREPFGIYEPDIVQHVEGAVLTEAINWSNDRIRKYLDRQYLD